MVRMMNNYYSNQIEGNTTRPRDIERALAGGFDPDPERRALQQEHAAHVCLQDEIDRRAVEGTLADPSDPSFIKWLHEAFYEGAPEEMLTLRHAGQVVRIAPWEWRQGDVEVGVHVPPPFDAVPSYMAHFHTQFRLDWLHGQVTRTLDVTTAHHRLNFIHPFYDGNGRDSRLKSHAMAHHAGIGAGGPWSVSRGLARGLQDGLPGRDECQDMMQLADRVRQCDRDGRGNLSLAALVSFTKWFLAVCEDQVRFMAGLFDFYRLGERLARYAALSGLGERQGTFCAFSFCVVKLTVGMWQPC
jgi:Fic family protein